MQLNRRQQREQSRQTESESLLAVRSSVHWTVKVIRPSRSSDRSSPISAISADSCSSLNCYGLGAQRATLSSSQQPIPDRLAMNHVERFRAVMNFQAVDRLPRWEWAMWWD